MPEQLDFLTRFTSDLPETLETACRGGGKSQNGTIGANIIAVSEPETPLMWLAGDTGQLDQASFYMHKYVSLFGGWWGHSEWTRREKAFFPNGSTIDFSPMTMVSGPRKYTIIKDEGGKVVTPILKQAYKFADGMQEGSWDYPRRIRHITTLAYTSAIEPVYNDLEPRGLVWRFPEQDCPWVHENLIKRYGPNYATAIGRIYGRPYFNTEYRCIMDVPGMGFNIFNKIKVIDQAPKFYPGKDICLIGIDTNIGQGHAALVGIQQGDTIYLVDEWMGLALRFPVEPDDPPITDRSGLPLAWWIMTWQRAYPGQTAVICEEQGYSILEALGKLGVRGITGEPWSGAIQVARIPLTVDLCDQGVIQFLKDGVPKTIEECRKYYRDEKKQIPRQEDHHVDCLHHLVMGRSIQFPRIITHDTTSAWV